MADRGVSSVLGYALSLAIVTVLITGIFAGMGNTVETQREKAIRSELTVVGNRIAADISAVDRLTIALGSNADIRLRTMLPSRVAGQGYSINITDDDPTDNRFAIELATTDPDVTERVYVRSNTTLTTSHLPGGDVEVVFDGNSVEVRHA